MDEGRRQKNYQHPWYFLAFEAGIYLGRMLILCCRHATHEVFHRAQVTVRTQNRRGGVMAELNTESFSGL